VARRPRGQLLSEGLRLKTLYPSPLMPRRRPAYLKAARVVWGGSGGLLQLKEALPSHAVTASERDIEIERMAFGSYSIFGSYFISIAASR
jgi:hypothetical protein